MQLARKQARCSAVPGSSYLPLGVTKTPDVLAQDNGFLLLKVPAVQRRYRNHPFAMKV
jgi:hypothetical protein